jgi:uncharacterized protein YecT (DUF1311 family)
MKTFSVELAMLLASCVLGQPALAVNKRARDPCRTKRSNVDMRECYTTEHAKIDAQLKLYTGKIATALAEAIRKHQTWTVANDILGKTASGVAESEKSWKIYRDDYCTSVQDSYTTGSGAGTAYEECMFHLGQARLRELHRYFGSWLGEKPGKSDPDRFLL